MSGHARLHLVVAIGAALATAGSAAAQPMEQMPGMSMPAAPATPAPAAAGDHAADRDYAPAAMAHARAMMAQEMGGGTYAGGRLELGEFQSGADGGGYRWEGEAWVGGDVNRFVLRSEGAGHAREGLESAEIQALAAHAVGPYADLEAGLRQDVAPRARTYLALGARSLLPYWIEVRGGLYLSTKGELLARAEGTYDLRLTQHLVLQPRAELNLAAQDTPETRTGAGLANAELGLRLRYEVRREVAPYVGVSWDRRVGKSADFARAAGEGPGAAAFVVGLSALY